MLAYFGHHKCGTQWMNSIISDVCDRVGRELVVRSGPRTFDWDLPASIAHPDATFLCYVNAEKRFIGGLDPLLGFHMVRDPRDVVVSAYYSHLYSHPEYRGLARYRAELETLPKEEGLRREVDNRKHQFRAMLKWEYERDDVLELHMEDVTADPQRAIPEILAFLGLGPEQGLDHETVATIVEENDFSRKAGRPRGTEDVTSHYRKGVPGDWMEHFTGDLVEYFKSRHNDLLLKLGYETSPAWEPVRRAVEAATERGGLRRPAS